MSTASDISPAATTPVYSDGSGEWEERTLCPDDSCIGVLGPDGRCCLCGLRGDLSRPHHFAPPKSDPPPADEPLADEPSATDEAAMDASSAESPPARDEDSFGSRELCPNDSCIGVLSAEGICPLCQSRRP